jgi:hypothetical protein
VTLAAAALLMAAGTPTALAAERAFAADADRHGQWTAFRRWSAVDAIMFTPQPTNAHAFLQNRKDPPKAIVWWPTASYVACDGHWAVNTGGWQRPDGSVGFFSTVWHRGERGGWRWLVDGGDTLAAARPRPARPLVRHAACGGAGRANGYGQESGSGYGASDDATLRWHWHVAPDGARTFQAELWNGHGYDRVIDDVIAAAS